MLASPVFTILSKLKAITTCGDCGSIRRENLNGYIINLYAFRITNLKGEDLYNGIVAKATWQPREIYLICLSMTSNLTSWNVFGLNNNSICLQLN